MNRQELAAAAELFLALEKMLQHVSCSSLSRSNAESIERLASARSAIAIVGDDMKLCGNYPNLRGEPLAALKRRAEWLQGKLAQIEADAAAVAR